MTDFDGLTPPYPTIVADPPWHYEDGCVALGPGHGVLRANQPLPYSGMPTADICALPVAALADGDCRLWHKLDVNLRGSVAPNSAEFVYVATRGNPRRLGTVASSVLASARSGGHSAKPSAFGDLVERVSPGPYVELFARAPRLGWDAWGRGYELGGAA